MVSRHWARLGEMLFASHPERLIACARVVFGICALIAVVVDPTHPYKNIEETYTILLIYIIFAIASLSYYSVIKSSYTAQMVIHGTDILALSILVHLTDGLTSPFFAFLTFALLSAAMRWSWRGSVVTALILEVVLIGMSWGDLEITLSRESDLNLVVMRGANLLVAAAMLGYFSAYRHRSRGRLAKLAAWPPSASLDNDIHPLANSLQHAANVLGADRVLVVWLQSGDPRPHFMWWNDGECTGGRIPASISWSELLAATGRRPERLRALRAVTALLPSDARTPSQGSPGASELVEVGEFCSATFLRSQFHGMIFVLDPRDQSEDVASLAEIAAARIASELERLCVASELASAAMAEERVRLARDLHDSVLQDLTAASLRLKTISQRLPDQAREELQDVSAVLSDQQRRIRMFVEGVTPKDTNVQRCLVDDLHPLVETLARQWQCCVHLQIDPPHLSTPPSVSREVCQLLSEAIANAVKHGGARTVDVNLARTDDGLVLDVRDDGAGVPEGASAGIEPHSLAARVAELGGRLSFIGSKSGVELAIRFPG